MKEFEDLIEEIGGQGFYQKRLLYFVLSPLFFFLPLSWLNEIFLLHVPSHWCYHPSQDNLNASEIETWRNCFLPKEISAEGVLTPSSCKILIPSKFVDNQQDFWNDTRLWTKSSESCPSELLDGATVVACKLGWSFDKSEFTSTVPMENEWVCENQDFVPQLFTYGVVGSIMGTIVFSYLGDLVGRRMIFWITTAVVIIFMSAKTFLAPYFVAYLVFKLIASSSYVATYQLPFSIITEITDASYRSWAIGITCVTWTAGLCMLPLVGWLSGDWKVISLATVLPMTCVFAGWPFVPESPRWQLTRGHRDKAAKTIRQIAKVNKRPEPKDLENRLDAMIDIIRQERNLGYISLFTRKGLAIKTFNVTIALVASNFVYYQLMLNIGNMSGSTFLNFFLLSVIEGPAYFLGVWLADKAGRRWSHTCLLTLNSMCLLFNCYLSVQPDLSLGAIIFCLIAKFNCSASFVIVYVQTVELFPTCIRNTGMGFTSLLAMVIGISGPYVVHLGTVDVRYPYGIMAIISICGAVAASFLPETVGVSLPETLAEAAEFGRSQKFFSWIKPKNHNEEEDKNREKRYEDTYRKTDGEDFPLNSR